MSTATLLLLSPATDDLDAIYDAMQEAADFPETHTFVRLDVHPDGTVAQYDAAGHREATYPTFPAALHAQEAHEAAHGGTNYVFVTGRDLP